MNNCAEQQRYEAPSLVELGGFAEQTRGIDFGFTMDVYGRLTFYS